MLHDSGSHAGVSGTPKSPDRYTVTGASSKPRLRAGYQMSTGRLRTSPTEPWSVTRMRRCPTRCPSPSASSGALSSNAPSGALAAAPARAATLATTRLNAPTNPATMQPLLVIRYLLVRLLVGQTIADLELHREDPALISQRGGSAIGELVGGARRS